VLDDVALLTKAATRKTAGVLGDDLALNAQQVAGVRANRELPVVWAVGKGSLVNKAILVPAALAISVFVPWLVTPLLMLGGAFLCYEGFEKVAHKFLAPRGEDAAHQEELQRAVEDAAVDMVALEKDKIRGAIRTDFILSAEIIVIALGTVATQAFGIQVAVLVGIGLLMTVGVYGLVAGIVKLDDFGLLLARRAPVGALNQMLRTLGRGIVVASPWLMKFLSIAGTVAMFLVGGSILSHGLPFLHYAAEAFTTWITGVPGVGGALAVLAPMLFDLVAGLVAGAIVVAIVSVARRFMPSRGGMS
jgi:predicted DNA repair protein MutK